MKKFVIFFFSVLWTLWSIALLLFHWGTLTPPEFDKTEKAQATFYQKTDEQPLQNLVLIGPPFARGVEAGRLTYKLLYEQEKELTTMLKKIFPWRPLFHAFELVLIPIFKGVENTLSKDDLLEMYGVSLSTNPEFDVYAEAYTRQIAYHGLHEVGQMMVDQYQDDRLENMGCTALLVPYKSSWLIGRNFDFEGGVTMDEKKILKWVFPSDGKHAYVSAIWSGMVGAVTAVNEHGLYMSINAAGSKDFNRRGLPSTLLVSQVMTLAKNTSEALALIRNTPIMIT
jgi:isopenicillin-N N-acyltransferase like protein